jgi:hypothetical protein
MLRNRFFLTFKTGRIRYLCHRSTLRLQKAIRDEIKWAFVFRYALPGSDLRGFSTTRLSMRNGVVMHLSCEVSTGYCVAAVSSALRGRRTAATATPATGTTALASVVTKFKEQRSRPRRMAPRRNRKPAFRDRFDPSSFGALIVPARSRGRSI